MAIGPVVGHGKTRLQPDRDLVMVRRRTGYAVAAAPRQAC
jgi:hypothetical protein